MSHLIILDYICLLPLAASVIAKEKPSISVLTIADMSDQAAGNSLMLGNVSL